MPDIDLDGLMKKVQGMMGNAQEMRARLAKIIVTGSAGGGMVRANMNCAGDLVGLEMEREVVNPGDVEMLCDLVVAAVADAKRKSQERIQGEAGRMAGGLDLSALGLG